MFRTNVVENIKTYILCLIIFFFFENLAVCEIMWKNIVEPYRSQTMRTRIACWMIKATNTHSAYVILIAFPPPQWLHEHTSMLRYTYSRSYTVLHTKYRYSCQIWMKREPSRQIFEEYSNIKFHEIAFGGSRVVPCGQTDRHDAANSRLSQFCERAHELVSLYPLAFPLLQLIRLHSYCRRRETRVLQNDNWLTAISCLCTFSIALSKSRICLQQEQQAFWHRNYGDYVLIVYTAHLYLSTLFPSL